MLRCSHVRIARLGSVRFGSGFVWWFPNRRFGWNTSVIIFFQRLSRRGFTRPRFFPAPLSAPARLCFRRHAVTQLAHLLSSYFPPPCSLPFSSSSSSSPFLFAALKCIPRFVFVVLLRFPLSQQFLPTRVLRVLPPRLVPDRGTSSSRGRHYRWKRGGGGWWWGWRRRRRRRGCCGQRGRRRGETGHAESRLRELPERLQPAAGEEGVM